jgi:hypothetical protein
MRQAVEYTIERGKYKFHISDVYILLPFIALAGMIFYGLNNATLTVINTYYLLWGTLFLIFLLAAWFYLPFVPWRKPITVRYDAKGITITSERKGQRTVYWDDVWNILLEPWSNTQKLHQIQAVGFSWRAVLWKKYAARSVFDEEVSFLHVQERDGSTMLVPVPARYLEEAVRYALPYVRDRESFSPLLTPRYTKTKMILSMPTVLTGVIGLFCITTFYTPKWLALTWFSIFAFLLGMKLLHAAWIAFTCHQIDGHAVGFVVLEGAVAHAAGAVYFVLGLGLFMTGAAILHTLI